MLFSQEACDACRGFVSSFPKFTQGCDTSTTNKPSDSKVQLVEENNPPPLTMSDVLANNEMD